MFAGIVETVGEVARVETSPRADRSGAGAYRLDVNGNGLLDELPHGASVAINGVCLTLTGQRGTVGTFDIVPETWRSTSLRTLRAHARVNVERSLRVGDRIDGHFVQGHADGVGTVERIEQTAGEWKLWVRAATELMPYVVRKGSIALDGTSLTVVDVAESRFSVALIPTTLEQTVLGQRSPGDEINIETDILARIVISRLGAAVGGLPEGSGGITLEGLREGGWT